MTLIEPYFGRGYNITMDNFFTSVELAQKLLDRRTSLVGTLRLNRKEIPVSSKMATHDSVFYSCDSLNLVKYQAKPTKTVVVLSTLHKGAACQTDGKKARISPLLQRKQVRSGHAGFHVSADVYKGRLSTMAACCILEHTGHSWHQCVDPVQKDDECTDITATVLASAVRRTERNINIIRKHTSSSINLIVFNHDSTW